MPRERLALSTRPGIAVQLNQLLTFYLYSRRLGHLKIFCLYSLGSIEGESVKITATLD